MFLTYRRNADGAREVAERIRADGGQAFVTDADLSEDRDVVRLVGAAFAELGRADIWVNNAGADILTGARRRAHEPVAKLDGVLAVDLRGTVLCSWRAARTHARPGARA